MEQLLKSSWSNHFKIKKEIDAHSGCSLGASIRRARYAEGLLRLGLIGALLALHAFVQGAVQISPRFADGQRTLLYRRWSHVRGCSANGAGLARSLNALGPVTTSRAGLAFPLHGQLLPRAALVPALLPGHSFRRPRRFAEAAQQTGEASLVRLIETVAAASAQACQVVVVLACRATLLAVGCAACTRPHRHAWTAGYHGTGAALQLTRLALIASNRARYALLRFLVVERSHGARNCDWNYF